MATITEVAMLLQCEDIHRRDGATAVVRMPDAMVVDMTHRQPMRRYPDGTTASGSSFDRSKVAFPYKACALATKLERAAGAQCTRSRCTFRRGDRVRSAAHLRHGPRPADHLTLSHLKLDGSL